MSLVAWGAHEANVSSASVATALSSANVSSARLPSESAV